MKARRSGMLLAIFSAALVVVLVYLDLDRGTPGELARVHAQDERLRSGGCEQCHGDGGLAVSCATCHAEVGAQIAGGTGFHGNLAESERSSCARCHADHHGAEHELAGERAFALAGFDPRASYDHRGLGLELVGRHVELDCVECHERADAQVLPVGSPRFLGLEARCATCHEDPHAGRMSRGCEACHGQSGPFDELAAFVHRADFPLAGGHAGLDCAACHEPEGPYSVEASASHDPPPERGCVDCHDSPHAVPFLDGVAALLVLDSARGCEECHAADAERWDAAAENMRPELHEAGGFALDAPHAGLDCAQCHAPAGDFGLRYPGRGADDCAACHDDPHGGQFSRGPQPAKGCLDCHARHAFAPPRFGLAEHARTPFPLEGEHVAAACVDCHAEGEAEAVSVRLFRGTPSDCASCHADAHALARGGAFAAFDAEGMRVASDCAECHAPTAFGELAREDFDHAHWTGFALDGAHVRADCERCHVRTAQPDSSGRMFGQVAVLFGEPVDRCATCHADVHMGRFDKPGPPGADAGQGCARCHDTEAFDALDRRAFDHGHWTAFALDGAHAAASCESCHPRMAQPDELGRQFGFAMPPAQGCLACHADPHGGRFDRPDQPISIDGAQGCARCHTTGSFRAATASFEHGLWTGFALDGAHASASCSACHPRDIRPGAPALGAALGSACADCHADPHAGQFLVAGTTDCARCHQSAASFAELVFDHERDARFKLDAKHAELACSACHIPWPLESGGEVVRYKPLGTACADCHAPGSLK